MSFVMLPVSCESVTSLTMLIPSAPVCCTVLRWRLIPSAFSIWMIPGGRSTLR